jgi:hypothetical protein
MTHLPRREQLRHRIPSRNRDFPRYLTTVLQPPGWRYERDRDAYTYRFKLPLPQRDPVLRRINTTIRDLVLGKSGLATPATSPTILLLH